jgi:hypothetical protein
MRDVTQSVFESRWVIRKPSCGTLDRRGSKHRTCTAKLLNSNSLIGTNNRFASPLELVKNFIFISIFLSPSMYVEGAATSIALALDSAFSLSD